MPKKKDKKKTDTEEDGGKYNVEKMTTQEMRLYAHMLEKDIEEMRNQCNFYQKAEDQQLGFLRLREEALEKMDILILAKDVEREKLYVDVLQKVKEKQQFPKYLDFKNEEHEKRQAKETAAKLEEGFQLHLEMENQLKGLIEEKERQLEAESMKTQMERRHLQEKNEDFLKEIDENEKSRLGELVQAFRDMITQANDQFRLGMESIESSALEDKRRAEMEFNESYTSYKERLRQYYKSVTRQDLNEIKQMQSKIENLKVSVDSTRSKLNWAKELQAGFKSGSISKSTRRKVQKSYNLQPKVIPQLSGHSSRDKVTKESRVKQLEVENQKLFSKIRDTEDQTDNLRSEFTESLHKIRLSAEMKPRFLENKITSFLNIQNPSEKTHLNSSNESNSLILNENRIKTEFKSSTK